MTTEPAALEAAPPAAPAPDAASSSLLLPAALFAATLASTLWVGGGMGIANWSPELFGDAGRALSGGEWIAAWAWYGAPYALSLLLILLSHEMGHWFAARYYQVRASLPYFLPMPLTLVGTLGAFIRIRSPFPNRKALLDVGLAGPFAGFIVCLPVLALGVATSRSGPLEPGGLQFGEPLAFQFFAWAFGPAVPEGQALYLSPIGLAAWFGLLLTAINLLPMGQLDGGHALYAVFRRKALRISRSVHLLMFPLAILSPGWLVWGLLGLLLGARRPHPPTLNDGAPLPGSRVRLAWAALVTFAVCFTPEPVVMDWSILLGG